MAEGLEDVMGEYDTRVVCWLYVGLFAYEVEGLVGDGLKNSAEESEQAGVLDVEFFVEGFGVYLLV